MIGVPNQDMAIVLFSPGQGTVLGRPQFEVEMLVGLEPGGISFSSGAGEEPGCVSFFKNSKLALSDRDTALNGDGCFVIIWMLASGALSSRG